MKITSFALAAVLFASTVLAQQPVPAPTPSTTKLAWNHDGVNVDGFRLTIDGGTPTDLGAVTRQADGHYEIAFPALTPGLHTLSLVAYNIAGNSASAVLSVRLVAIPADPTNLRIIQ